MFMGQWDSSAVEGSWCQAWLESDPWNGGKRESASTGFPLTPLMHCGMHIPPHTKHTHIINNRL